MEIPDPVDVRLFFSKAQVVEAAGALEAHRIPYRVITHDAETEAPVSTVVAPYTLQVPRDRVSDAERILGAYEGPRAEEPGPQEFETSWSDEREKVSPEKLAAGRARILARERNFWIAHLVGGVVTVSVLVAYGERGFPAALFVFLLVAVMHMRHSRVRCPGCDGLFYGDWPGHSRKLTRCRRCGFSLFAERERP